MPPEVEIEERPHLVGSLGEQRKFRDLLVGLSGLL